MFRHPLNYGFHNFISNLLIIDAPCTELVYAVIILTALGVSLGSLVTIRLRSHDPIFAKEKVKLSRFRNGEYESLAPHEENANGVSHDRLAVIPEEFKGWRLAMGVLLGIVLIALVIVHTLILITNGPSLLRIVFIVYWVCSYDSKLMVGRCTGL